LGDLECSNCVAKSGAYCCHLGQCELISGSRLGGTWKDWENVSWSSSSDAWNCRAS
jgi:hypothetical protein